MTQTPKIPPLDNARIAHDPEALWASRFEIRRAYAAIRRLRQADPTVRDMLNRLDELAVELTVELESIQPEMELRGIRVISVAPGIDRVMR